MSIMVFLTKCALDTLLDEFHIYVKDDKETAYIS